MTVNLPYNTGTKFKRWDEENNNPSHTDILQDYILTDGNVYVILDIQGKPSVPIDLNVFLREWRPLYSSEL